MPNLLKFRNIYSLLVFSTCLCAEASSGQNSANSTLKESMTAFLQHAMRQQAGWVKVHAAEALLNNDMPQGVQEPFIKELATDDPQYRIGVLRVLIQIPGVSQEQKQDYIIQIRSAFEDETGRARIHAIETLGKLNVHFRTKQSQDFASKVGDGKAAYGRWVLANSKNQADLDYLLELLNSGDESEISHVGYAVRYMNSIDSKSFDKLEKSFNKLDKKSPARIYILSALCKHVKDVKTKKIFENQVQQYLLKGNNDEKKEACVALANLGDVSGISFLKHFFEKETNIDVKIFAAAAILKLLSNADNDWPVDRRYRLKIDVDPKTIAKVKNAPFRVTVDFKKYLEQRGIPGNFDPESVVIVQIDSETGWQSIVDHLTDETFQVADKGWVGWNINRPGQNQYLIYFDVADNGSFKKPGRYVPIIGFGDNPRYNNPDQLSPIHAHGIFPVCGDFDGDGLVDIISPQIYTDTWGQPSFMFRFWKNIKNNKEPVFADFVRLCADGKTIGNGYNNCGLLDWNKDGRFDLVTTNGIFLNTGELNPSGVPILKKVADFKMPGGLIFRGFRDVDFDGDLDAVFMKYNAHYIYEGKPARNFIRTGLYVAYNSAEKGDKPKFDKPVALFEQELLRENVLMTDIYDINLDGRPDIVGTTMPLYKNPPEPKVCYWLNISKKGQKPGFGPMKICPKADVLGSTFITSADNPAFNGLFISEGHRIRYFEKNKGNHFSKFPGHVDKGLLMQVDGRCGVDGYSGVEVKDWEGDGDWDLIAGDEMGQVWLIKNVGNNDRPVFETARNIMADGKPIRVLRWQFIPDGNPEYFLGQAKPRYADWDGDGDFDLIVANNTDGLVFFENIGTRERPVFSTIKKIKIDGDTRPFAYRNQPAVLDWDGDGVTDIVTKDKAGRLGLFKGMKQGENSAKPIEVFKFADGSEMNLGNLGSVFWQWEACDWDGDGDYDLISQIGSWGNSGPGLYENVGTNAEPRFKQAVRLKCFGKDIHLSNHETTFSCVDWYGQGKPDLFCGGESGWFYFFRRAALDVNQSPSCKISNELEVKK